MRTHRPKTPPRLGFALLERVASRNESLAGDLVEGFHLTQSRLWFWRQLAWALATGPFRGPSEIRPLRLVDGRAPSHVADDLVARGRMLATRGLAASPIDGIGGTGLVAFIGLTLVVRPSALTIVPAGLLLGIVFGVARIAIHRRTVAADIFPRHVLLDGAPAAPPPGAAKAG